MGLFDTHSHYWDEKFGTAEERERVLGEVFGSGVDYVVNCGTTFASSLECLSLSEKFGGCCFAAGLHPEDISDDPAENDSEIEKIKTLLKHGKCVALGEIGLDYHWRDDNREEQKRVFSAQLGIASEYGLPVIIHDRDAHGDCFETVREHPEARGIFHSYSGSIETAKELLKRGWYISFSGVITFKNATKIAEIVKMIPDDRILIETDCPYLAPHPHRGERNDSRLMRFTAEKAAELRNTGIEEFISLTNTNAKQLFGIE